MDSGDTIGALGILPGDELRCEVVEENEQANGHGDEGFGGTALTAAMGGLQKLDRD